MYLKYLSNNNQKIVELQWIEILEDVLNIEYTKDLNRDEV